MKEIVRGDLIRLTDILMKRPLNSIFCEDVRKNEGYTDIIEEPMDFGIVSQKLRKGEYKHPSQWYRDIMLIYDNAVEYNKGNIEIVNLAKHQQNVFRKMAPGYSCHSSAEWYQLLARYHKKVLNTAANKDPVPVGIDPLVEDLVRTDRGMPPRPKEILDTIETLKQWVKEKNNDCLRAVTYILKVLQPDILKGSGTIDVDFAKLNESTMKCLFRYVKMHDTTPPVHERRH